MPRRNGSPYPGEISAQIYTPDPVIRDRKAALNAGYALRGHLEAQPEFLRDGLIASAIDADMSPAEFLDRLALDVQRWADEVRR